MKILLFTLIMIQILIAAPAYHAKRAYTQPDGTIITYRNKGDEHFNWTESDDGNIIIYNKKNKRMEFAEIKNGSLKASGIMFSKKRTSSSTYRSSTATPRVTKEQLQELYKSRHEHYLQWQREKHRKPSSHLSKQHKAHPNR